MPATIYQNPAQSSPALSGARIPTCAEELSRDEFRLLQYHFVELFVGHLLDVSKAFRGDLTELFVMATVGQAHIRGDELGHDHAPINATSISEVTGIPRQTVRRKLQALEKRGWVQQIDGKGWQLAMDGSEAVARLDLPDLTQGGINRVLKLIRATSTLMKI